MRSLLIILSIFLIPSLVLAQANEPVKSNKNAKKANNQQVFVFPDSITFYKKELNELVEEKTKALTRSFKKIAVSNGAEQKQEIASAMQLFNNNEKRLVTVTSKKNPEPVTKPIRKYLNDLAQLHYSKVSIVWHNAEYVSNFVKQPDGTYAALVAFEQEFTGIKTGEANYTYHDVTQKRIEITVKVWDPKAKKKGKEYYMDVFLGNIGVTEE
jgi:hypothetical protein